MMIVTPMSWCTPCMFSCAIEGAAPAVPTRSRQVARYQSVCSQRSRRAAVSPQKYGSGVKLISRSRSRGSPWRVHENDEAILHQAGDEYEVEFDTRRGFQLQYGITFAPSPIEGRPEVSYMCWRGSKTAARKLIQVGDLLLGCTVQVWPNGERTGKPTEGWHDTYRNGEDTYEETMRAIESNSNRLVLRLRRQAALDTARATAMQYLPSNRSL
mmetsp:Transcript_50231/g.93553  ORF Transcript_50231/g.93553 Transcript_50231/m.93553 type:complete len:213 (+) Transcript_50231:68-706(+)